MYTTVFSSLLENCSLRINLKFLLSNCHAKCLPYIGIILIWKGGGGGSMPVDTTVTKILLVLRNIYFMSNLILCITHFISIHIFVKS